MVRTQTAVIAALLLAACSTNEATPSAGPSAGKVSLQTPPYSGEATAAAPVTPLATPPVTSPASAPGTSLAAVASQFDPGRQHFVWVLPPGIHGEGPWDLAAVVKLRNEPKFETTLPLKAQIVAAGSRPEFPAGYEIVRLTDDGRWAERTAELDKVIAALVAEHGRGHGELEMTSQLHIRIDPAARAQHCAAGARPDIRLYLEETGQPLVRLDHPNISTLIAEVVRKACA
jgi:hypothetical protein